MQTLTAPEWFAGRLLRRLGKASCPAPACKRGADRCGSTWPAESGSRKGYPPPHLQARLQPTIHPWSKVALGFGGARAAWRAARAPLIALLQGGISDSRSAPRG